MARNEQLIRQLKLLQILEASRYGMKLEELREELTADLGLTKLSDRTVRRDLQALQMAGIHVDTEEVQRGTVWKLSQDLKDRPTVSPSLTELLALAMVRELALPLNGTPYWQGLEALWNRLRETIPESVWKHFDRRRQMFTVRGTPVKSYVKQEGIMATLNRAILQNRIVEIDYQSRTQDSFKTRKIKPYAIVFFKGSLYVLAADCQDPPDAEVRHFKLDRFHKATTLDDYFKPPEDFDPEEHFSDSIGIFKSGEAQEFRIRLHQEVVLWVGETPWHPKQRIEQNEDGDAILIIPSAYEEEIIPQVLALNVKAEILAPQACRERMAQLLQHLAKSYTE
ncbi:Transcriptional regulator [Planctomycetales bacterium 10988]|nr:Transcriptional regulator [Planctomycetales bacterium 10988]